MSRWYVAASALLVSCPGRSRHALAEWLAAERTCEIDRRYADAYVRTPQSDDDIDSARVRSSRSLPQGWADLEW